MLYQNFEECLELRIRKDSEVGSTFLPRKRRYPPTLGNKKARRVNDSRTEYEKTARPLASPCISRSHQQLANIGTQLSKPDRRQARRAARPFSQSGSRTFVQSGNCSAAASQSTVPFRLASFSYNTYLFDWFGSIIPQPHWVVKPFSDYFGGNWGFVKR